MPRRARVALLWSLVLPLCLAGSCAEREPGADASDDNSVPGDASGAERGAATINVPADAPELPAAAINEQVTAVLWVDLATLTAETLNRTFDAALRDVEQVPRTEVRSRHVDPMLTGLAAFQRRFTEAGGRALVVGFAPADHSEDGADGAHLTAFLLARVGQDPDDAALGASFESLPQPLAWLNGPVAVEPLDEGWRVIRPAGDGVRSVRFTAPRPAGAGSSRRTARFRALLAAASGAVHSGGRAADAAPPEAPRPIRLAMVVTDAWRAHLPDGAALQRLDGPEALALSVLRRLSVGQAALATGDRPSVAARGEFVDDSMAQRGSLLLEALVNSLQAELAAVRWGSDGNVDAGPDAGAMSELLPARSGEAVGLMIEPAALRRLVGKVVVPAMTTQRMSAEQATSATNLRNIGLAIRLHAATHGGRFPEGFAPLLRSGDLAPKMLIHPANRGGDTPPTGDPDRLARWAAQHADYTITVFGAASDVSADAVIGHEKITPDRRRLAVLFGDGEVRILPVDAARRMIEAGRRDGA